MCLYVLYLVSTQVEQQLLEAVRQLQPQTSCYTSGSIYLAQAYGYL